MAGSDFTGPANVVSGVNYDPICDSQVTAGNPFVIFYQRNAVCTLTEQW